MLRRTFASACKTGKRSRFCAVVGAQWGDEGKGKLVDILARKYDVVARFNGGANAGHTVKPTKKKTFAFHMLPCGVLNPKTINIIGNGCVVQLSALFEELKTVTEAGYTEAKQHTFISDRAHIVTAGQMEADGKQETSMGSNSIGTTKRGIGPTYCTKALRLGLRMGDLKHPHTLKDKHMRLYEFLTKAFDVSTAELNKELDYLKQAGEDLKENITDTSFLMNQSIASKKRILCEGANALMLDTDHGTYPYVTSSSTGVAGICSGLGVAPHHIQTVIGVMKAYTTRVGSGPFPTEDLGDAGTHMQTMGKEVGVTTGRKRRCGWLDLPVLKYTSQINGYSSLNITKLDILDELDYIKVGTAYLDSQGNETRMPSTIDDLAKVKVRYETLRGWRADTSKITSFEALPPAAKDYIAFIEKQLGVQIAWCGVGPARKNMLFKPIVRPPITSSY